MYVLANIAFYTTLTPAEVLGSEAVAAVSHGDGDGDGDGDVFDQFLPPDLWRATVRLHGIHHTSVCRHVLLWGGQWHPPHLIKVKIMFGIMIAFVVGFLGFNRVLFLRLFYAGAVQGQMPEILSMIQVCVSAQLYHLFQFVRFHSPTLLIHILGGQVDSSSCRSHCGEIVVFYIFPQLF